MGLSEPARPLGQEPRHGVPLRCQVAPHGDGVTTQAADLGPQLVTPCGQHLVFQGVHLVVHLGEHRCHALQEAVGDRDQEISRIHRSHTRLHRRAQVVHRHDFAPSHGDHPVGFDPQAHRDHVLGVGARVEVHPAQDDQQTILHRDAARPGLVGQQGLHHHRRDTTLLLQPAACLRVIEVEVQPHQPRVGDRAGPVPADLSTATLAVQAKSVDQSVRLRHCVPFRGGSPRSIRAVKMPSRR